MTLKERIETAKNSLAAATTDEQRDLFRLGIQKLEDLLAEQQKKSESQPTGKTGQLEQKPERRLPTKEELQAWQKGMGSEVQEEVQDPSYTQEYVQFEKEYFDKTPLKTVKAPAFVAPDELINVELEDSKGSKQVKTFSKAQVRALTRKYFSNVHESWLGKEKKMGVGFKNLLAYVVAWKEFDGALPVLRDVLPDYDRYNKGGDSKEASEAFKVAQELYGKIVEILNQWNRNKYKRDGLVLNATHAKKVT